MGILDKIMAKYVESRVKAGKGPPKGQTHDFSAVKKLENWIERYGLDNCVKILESGGAGGIKFDITITKADLQDKELMASVESLMIASQQGSSQAAVSKKPKEIERLEQIMPYINSLANLQPGQKRLIDPRSASE